MNNLVDISKVRFSIESKYPSIAACAISTIFLVLGACSSPAIKVVPDINVPESGADESSDYALISANLLDAVSQYPDLNPHLATVQVSAADSEFEQVVFKELENRGYKVETVSAGEGANRVEAEVKSTRTESTDTQVPDAHVYVVSVGPVSAEREFVQLNGQVVPVSEMVIRGAEKRTITLSDKEVFGSENELFTKIAFLPAATPILDDVFKSLPSADDMHGAKTAEQPLRKPIKRNVYDNLQSNYAGLFDDYEAVEQAVLVFPNDSLRLGDANKLTIEQYVAKMDPETDVLSVIGCSHGDTKINNGNPLLAIGRANRVKEAFLFSGVDNEQVLEEGCWAPDSFEGTMPDRGVLLTLKRRKPS